jgi:hypothetical protein
MEAKAEGGGMEAKAEGEGMEAKAEVKMFKKEKNLQSQYPCKFATEG